MLAKRRRHKLGRATAGLMAGLLGATIAFEAALRLIEATPLWRWLPAAEVALYGPDPATGYALRPGVSGIWTTENRSRVAINSLGLRDAEMGAGKPPDNLRVGVMGDSITEALQVNLADIFVQRAERALQAEGKPVELANLALSGATPAVMVERLRSRGAELGLDGAVIILSWRDLARPVPDEDVAFPGYVEGPDGRAVIGHAFRDTRGFALRNSAAGTAFYWLLDHLRTARVVNNRMNVGVLHEWAVPDRGKRGPDCDGSSAEALARFAFARHDTFAGKRFDAFLDDLSGTALRVAVLIRGMGAACGDDEAKRRQAVAAILADASARLGGPVLDMDAEVARRLPSGVTMRQLQGFRTRIGTGHLNETGHAVYAEVLRDVIAALRK